MRAQVLGFLLLIWEIQMEFLVPDFVLSLAVVSTFFLQKNKKQKQQCAKRR